MAIIQPFKGWLPKPEFADEVACVPYDVINSEEAKELAKGKPHSFLHVIRPEIDLPDGTPFNDDAVYAKGSENLKKLLDSDLMVQDEIPAVYIYQLEVDGRTQTGVYTGVSVQDYDSDIILKHELTRPDKEDDRTRHILTQSAHAEPVMLTFKDTTDVTFLMEKTMMTTPPTIEFQAGDGVWHRIWRAPKASDFAEAFANIPNLYVADGHHRCKSASRAAEELREKSGIFPGEAEFEYFPAVLFPLDQMTILPYNRIVYKATDEQLEELKSRYSLTPGADSEPKERGKISAYFKGAWHSLRLPEPASDNSTSQLDVSRLQDGILTPIFGISDPRRDSNISFVGGIRGTAELEKLVNNGKADIAFSLYHTSIEELVDVSDQGLLMPPKSTWFEPKLRSGLIIHTF